jgi:hypothetical protein
VLSTAVGVVVVPELSPLSPPPSGAAAETKQTPSIFEKKARAATFRSDGIHGNSMVQFPRRDASAATWRIMVCSIPK